MSCDDLWHIYSHMVSSRLRFPHCIPMLPVKKGGERKYLLLLHQVTPSQNIYIPNTHIHICDIIVVVVVVVVSVFIYHIYWMRIGIVQSSIENIAIF